MSKNNLPLVQRLSSAPVAGMTLANCSMLRLDRINPPAGGNKYFKLRRHLAGLDKGQKIVSFGGAWSNHLHALAAAGAQHGFETVGIVRGEAGADDSAMLRDARAWGMQIIHVTRGEYRQRNEGDYLQKISQQFAPSRHRICSTSLLIPIASLRTGTTIEKTGISDIYTGALTSLSFALKVAI